MNANVTLNQIIWEEVRKYRLEQRAKQLQEIVITPTTKSTSSTTTASTTAKGSNTTAKTSATKTTTATAKPTASTSPFKNQEEASKFHKYAEGELQGGKAAKPDMNDPKLIDLYYKYKTQYKEWSKTDTAYKQDQEIDPATGKPTGGVKSGDFFLGYSMAEWMKWTLVILAIGVGIKFLRWVFKGSAAILKRVTGSMTREQTQQMLDQAMQNASPQELMAMVKDRNWFMKRLTNLFRKNKREVNKAFKDMDINANAVGDTEIIEIGEAVGKTFASRAAYIAAKRALLKNVVKTLNAGKIPRGMTLSQFLDNLSQAERAKYGTRIQQRWENVMRNRGRKAVAKKVYNKGKTAVQNYSKKS